MADITQIAANGINYNIKDATARSDIATANTNISSLADDMETAEGNITSIGTRMTTAEGDIDTLEGKMTTAEGNIALLQTAVGGMFSQEYQSVAVGSTLYFTLANTEPGFVVTSGADGDARGMIIYYSNASGVVSAVKAFGAEDVQIITSTNQLALKNNSGAYLFAMRFYKG